MGWLIPRLLAGVLAVAAGALLGMLVGGIMQWPAVGTFIGASTAALLYGFVDAWRAHRFMNWLRGQNEGAAPRDAGFWGEVGYRVERSVRLLERRVETENMGCNPGVIWRAACQWRRRVSGLVSDSSPPVSSYDLWRGGRACWLRRESLVGVGGRTHAPRLLAWWQKFRLREGCRAGYLLGLLGFSRSSWSEL